MSADAASSPARAASRLPAWTPPSTSAPPAAPSPAPAPPAAPAPPTAEPASRPARPSADPQVGWRRLLQSLKPFEQEDLHQGAGIIGLEGGTLVIAVRAEPRRGRVERILRDADLGAFFEGFRRFEVRVTEAGQTGRERMDEDARRRAEEARAQAEASRATELLRARFGAVLVEVVAAAPPTRDTWADTDEEHDEQPV